MISSHYFTVMSMLKNKFVEVPSHSYFGGTSPTEADEKHNARVPYV